MSVTLAHARVELEPEAELVVSADRLTRRYGDGDTAVDALRGVSLDIPRGQLVEKDRGLILAPELGMLAQQSVDQVKNLALRRKVQVGTIKTLIEANQDSFVQETVGSSEKGKDIGVQLAK